MVKSLTLRKKIEGKMGNEKTKLILCIIIGMIILIYCISFAVEFTVPTSPNDITYGDIDYDGDWDISIPSTIYYAPDTISILINNGYGNFNMAYIAKDNMHFLECVRIDDDDFPDFVTKIGGENYQFVYYKNNGDGSFGEAINIHTTLSDHQERMVISDLNNDEDYDIIYFHDVPDNYWGIIDNDGYGNFTDIYYCDSIARPIPAPGDFNNDSLNDIFVNGTPDVVYINEGNYQFQMNIIEPLIWLHSTYACDINNDNYQDIVGLLHRYMYGLPCELYLLYNYGYYTFTDRDTLEFPCGTLIVDIADYNNDNYPDLTYQISTWENPGGDHNIYVCLNNQDGTFSEPISYYIGFAFHGFKVCSADFDGNNYNDLAITKYKIDDVYYGVRILFNDGNGNFLDEPQVAVDNYELGITNYELTNYSNPFKSNTTISFSLAKNVKNVGLNIYNIKGKLVRKLLNNRIMYSGNHFIQWDGKDNKGKEVSSNVYIYRLRIGDKSISKKMLLVR